LSIENIEPYDGQITLFRPGERSDTTSDPTLGWREVALKGVDIMWTPGDHESMFFEPNLDAFGRLLDTALEKKGYRKNSGVADSHGAFYEIPVQS
jgi:thioesterase domain-containing protein